MAVHHDVLAGQGTGSACVYADLTRLYAYLTGLYGAKAAVMGEGPGRALAAVTDGLEDML